jgi:DNA polymerase III alpha subunit (gram-positive type)
MGEKKKPKENRNPVIEGISQEELHGMIHQCMGELKLVYGLIERFMNFDNLPATAMSKEFKEYLQTKKEELASIESMFNVLRMPRVWQNPHAPKKNDNDEDGPVITWGKLQTTAWANDLNHARKNAAPEDTMKVEENTEAASQMAILINNIKDEIKEASDLFTVKITDKTPPLQAYAYLKKEKTDKVTERITEKQIAKRRRRSAILAAILYFSANTAAHIPLDDLTDNLTSPPAIVDKLIPGNSGHNDIDDAMATDPFKLAKPNFPPPKGKKRDDNKTTKILL